MSAEEVHQSAPRRRWLVLGTALALVLALVVTYISLAFTLLGPCGGDGGSPYAAPASPAGRYCESPLPPASVIVGVLVAVGGSIAAMVRRRWRPHTLFTVAGLALVLSPPVLGSLLPDRCGDDPTSEESVYPPDSDEYYREKPDCAHY